MKKRKFLLYVLLLAAFTALGFSAYRVAVSVHGYSEAKRSYEEVGSRYVQMIPAVQAKHPDGEPKEVSAPITVDFDALTAESPDIVGWLYLPDTIINYPIVQGEPVKKSL